MPDTCVCCGDYTPEGRQVCWACEHGYEPITLRGGQRMRRNKDIEWHEIRHRIYTLRRMNLWFWQLTDSDRRIVAEGSRRDCQETMAAIRRGQYAPHH